jgi:hypothetical protein
MITEAADHHDVNLGGFKVMQCVVDHAFTLELDKERQRVTIRVSGPFSLTQGGAMEQFDAEANPTGLGPALGLSRTSVHTAVMHNTGDLELAFEDGSVMRVPSDADYEAWTLTVTDGPMVVGGPGGKLTFFGSPRPARASI